MLTVIPRHAVQSLLQRTRVVATRTLATTTTSTSAGPHDAWLLLAVPQSETTASSVDPILGIASAASSSAHSSATAAKLWPSLSASSSATSTTTSPLDAAALTRIESLFLDAGFRARSGELKVFFGLGGGFPGKVAVVGVGAGGAEATRRAVASGVRALRDHGAKRIALAGCDGFPHVQAAAEGATLGLFSYDALKSKKTPRVAVDLLTNGDDSSSSLAWSLGTTVSHAQNLARTLMETPANLMTPRLFCDCAESELANVQGRIEWMIHDAEWAERMGMNAFLSVTRGSAEPPRFLEVHYRGKDAATAPTMMDLALVGKGVTFDSGGISIKPSAGMALMRGDMGGAAVTFASILAIAKLRLPLNVSAFIPLCENMPSGTATKPGDVVVAMNGKSIEVDNTDAEGRLILADALWYAQSKFAPKRIVDVATLTGAMDVALGAGYTGVFSNSDELFAALDACGKRTGDPVWRMPLGEHYRKQIGSHVADLKNVGNRSAGSCTAAVFLEEFLTAKKSDDTTDESDAVASTLSDSDTVQWAHLDIAGVMNDAATHGHNIKGMSGRPVRTLVEFARSLSGGASEK